MNLTKKRDTVYVGKVNILGSSDQNHLRRVAFFFLILSYKVTLFRTIANVKTPLFRNYYKKLLFFVIDYEKFISLSVEKSENTNEIPSGLVTSTDKLMA